MARTESNGRLQSLSEQLEERLLDFSTRVGKVVDALPDTRLGRHIASQMVRSGTSPAPNYAEARAAESRRDFVHKLGVCLKELRETKSWLRLALRAELLPAQRLNLLLEESDQLISIMVKSIVTTKRNSRRKAAE